MVKRVVAFDNAQEKVRCDVERLLPGIEGKVRLIHTKTEFLQFVDSGLAGNQSDPHRYAGTLSRLNPGQTSNVYPDELFAMEGLNLPAGTYVVDTRLGTDVVEKVVGLDKNLPEASPPRRRSWVTMA